MKRTIKTIASAMVFMVSSLKSLLSYFKRHKKNHAPCNKTSSSLVLSIA
ncbi:hypothetical protein [Chryseobacterium ureilyticum]|nr:hypothetical protein [Chryseobacterium ureilyticum]